MCEFSPLSYVGIEFFMNQNDLKKRILWKYWNIQSSKTAGSILLSLLHEILKVVASLMPLYPGFNETLLSGSPKI